MERLLFFFEVAAVVAGALSGGLYARRKNMDFVGVYFVALATALGGGSVRDVLLGRFPVFWVKDMTYSLYVLGAGIAVVALHQRSVLERARVAWLIMVFDAIGLGLFSMVGATVALEFGCPFFPAVLVGVANGIAGGVIRDVLCNEVPQVFTPSTQLYATCSFVGCIAYLGLNAAGVEQGLAFGAGAVLALVIRLVAVRYKIGLPV